MIRAVDDDGETQWTRLLGEEHSGRYGSAYSVGYSIIEGHGLLFAGGSAWGLLLPYKLASTIGLYFT